MGASFAALLAAVACGGDDGAATNPPKSCKSNTDCESCYECSASLGICSFKQELCFRCSVDSDCTKQFNACYRCDGVHCVTSTTLCPDSGTPDSGSDSGSPKDSGPTSSPNGPATPAKCDSNGPSCTPPMVFQSSASDSGCFQSGTAPPDPITPAFDNFAGPCKDAGDKVIACPSLDCSYCAKPNALPPPGCNNE